MFTKYLIEFTRFKASATVKYNTDGILVELVYEPGTAPPDVVQYFYHHLPYKVQHLTHYKNFKNVKVTEVFESLDFDNFWNTYAYKDGNKSRAKRLWEALNNVERAKALTHIAVYERQLILKKGVAKLYPETYLHQQRWNN